MLKWAFTFFLISIVAAMLGFTNIAGPALGIAKVLFFIFIFTALLLVILGTMVFRSIRN